MLPRMSPVRLSGCAALAVACVALAGCDVLTEATDTAARRPGGSCAATVARTLERVGRRVYLQSAHGRAVAASTRRLARSSALAAAVARGDARAARAALRPLLRTQIKRIVVTRAGHRIVSLGRGVALAPVQGVIRDPNGTTVGAYTFSVAKAAATVRLIHALTGAKVVLRAGTSTPAGPRGATSGGSQVASFEGLRFPRGSVRISVLSTRTPGAARCGPTDAATAANTLGTVARHLFAAESRGGRVRDVLRIVARDPRFIHAVATDDPGALRAQIVRFFQDPRLHVVRIRATMASGRLINDVGGPYVLAPATRAVRAHGRTIGRVTLSIQDDAGYIQLVHRFTGAEVILCTAAGMVPGATLPLRCALPTRGTVTVSGRSYRVQSFAARRFPSGPLAVHLLVPTA